MKYTVFFAETEQPFAEVRADSDWSVELLNVAEGKTTKTSVDVQGAQANLNETFLEIIFKNGSRKVFPAVRDETTGTFLIATELGSLRLGVNRGSAASAGVGARARSKQIKSSMPGKVSRLLVEKDTVVEAGTPILIVEAMKMENEIRAPISGTLNEIYVTKDQKIETGEKLFQIKKL